MRNIYMPFGISLSRMPVSGCTLPRQNNLPVVTEKMRGIKTSAIRQVGIVWRMDVFWAKLGGFVDGDGKKEGVCREMAKVRHLVLTRLCLPKRILLPFTPSPFTSVFEIRCSVFKIQKISNAEHRISKYQGDTNSIKSLSCCDFTTHRLSKYIVGVLRVL